MKAMVINRFGEQMHLEDLPDPVPTDDEIKIKVIYASVNPVDGKIREGYLKDRIPHQFPLILGWDAAGIVSEVGKNVKNFKAGDEVFTYCRKPIVQWGTYAEYVCVDAHQVANKPSNINFAQAAAIPLVALTAWQALFDEAKLKKGETIFIQAGSGGVGSLAIQFAKNIGATVYTTTSEKNVNYVKKLGADEVIDYSQTDFVTAIKKLAPEGVDVIFDTVASIDIKKNISVVKANGRIVSIVHPTGQNGFFDRGIQFSYLFVSPNGPQLSQISNLITQNKIMIPNIEEMPLQEATKAQEAVRTGHTQGKIVLKIQQTDVGS